MQQERTGQVAKLQRERAENVAVAALLAQLVLGLVAFGVARLVAPEARTWATAVPAAGWFLIVGVGFWLMAWVHLRQLRLAEAEEAEWHRLLAEREAGNVRGSLFEEDELAAHAARNRLRILERYMLPVAGVLLALALAVLGWTLLPRAGEALRLYRPAAAQGASIMLIVAFGLFLLGMYASGMARHRDWRALKAGAGYMMASAIMAALVMVGLALAHVEYADLLRIAAWVPPVAMLLVALEITINFVLDFYRPRIEGVEYRPCYESRLLGLLTEPGGVFRTVATTLDYQFGFKVSETWFYRFIERAIMPLVLFGLATFYLLTCLVIIAPSEQVVFERFGRPIGEAGERVRGSGLYLKWPWPITAARRMDTRTIRKFSIGFDEEAEAAAHAPQSDYLWTEKHFEREYWVMVAEGRLVEDDDGRDVRREDIADAVPVGLIAAVADVYYIVDDLEEYLYAVSDPAQMLSDLAYREQQQLFSGVEFFAVMGRDRKQVSDDLKDRIQRASDQFRLGVRILEVCMPGIHPPVEEELGLAYENVVAAQQERQAEIYKGEAYANERRVSAEHEAVSMRSRAHGDRVATREAARGDAELHVRRIDAYDRSPRVYKMNRYLDAFEANIAKSNVRKYLITPNNVDLEVFSLDLVDRLTLSPAGIGLEEDF